MGSDEGGIVEAKRTSAASLEAAPRRAHPVPHPVPRPVPRASGLLRKAAAILLVLSSVTAGIIGLMLATEGNLLGIALIALTPLGIWTATRVTPEGGTTGYFDRNL